MGANSMWGLQSFQVTFRLLLCCFDDALINSKLDGRKWKSTPNHWLPIKGRDLSDV